MIFDQLLTLTSGMSLVGLGAAGNLTAVPSSLDATFVPLSTVRDIGSGERLSLHVHVTQGVDPTDNVDRAIEFVVAMATSTGFANLQQIAKSGPLNRASLYTGARFQVVIPAVQNRLPGTLLFAGINVQTTGGTQQAPADFTKGTVAMAFAMDTDTVIAIDNAENVANAKVVKVYPANATIT
jgi:hypothetical protein